MVCPACLSDLREAPGRCPICGADLARADAAPPPASVDRVDRIVEGEVCEATPDGERLESAAAVHTLTVVRPVEQQVSLIQRAAQLPALAWQRPAVRAAVKTGASAVALSLAARAVRQWLRPGAARRTVPTSALSTLMDALRERDLTRDNGSPHDQGVVVSETFVYIRRVIRR
jgi:hypothetical protein